MFRYHHKVPLDAPELELKATYGLASPEEFTIPEASSLWTSETYNQFDITKAPPRDNVRCSILMCQYFCANNNNASVFIRV